MELFYVIFFLAQGAIFSLTVKFFHDVYFRNVFRGEGKLRFVTYFFLTLQSFSAVYFETSLYVNATLGVLFQLLPLFLVKATLIQKLICYIFGSCFLMLTESLIAHIMTFFMGLGNRIPSSRSFEAVLMISIIRVAMLIMVYCYKNFTHLKTKASPTEKKTNFFQRYFYLFNTITALSAVYFLVLYALPVHIEGNVEAALGLSTSVMFFLVTNFISYIHNLDLEDYRRKTRLIHEETERYAREHRALGEYLKELSILKHDVKHQLLPILAEIPVENRNVMDKFNAIFDTVFSEEYQYFSQSSALDLLLNYQLYKAKQKNIPFQIQIEPNLEIFIESDVFSVILGNLLDNAREAQDRISEKSDKRISVHLCSQNTNLFIKVENPYEGEITLEQGLPPTTKSESNRHGLGLSTVKTLVERKGGVFRLSTENQIFEVEILLLNSL